MIIVLAVVLLALLLLRVLHRRPVRRPTGEFVHQFHDPALGKMAALARRLGATMIIPGTIVNVTSSGSSNANPSFTGNEFVIGQAARGALGVANPVTSLAQFVALYGGRTANAATAALYDAVDVKFQEGTQLVYVARVSGASAVAASHTLVDRAGSPLNTLTVTALGPGVWGNAITVAVANGTVSNTFILTIVNGGVTEVSPNLTSPTDAVNWAAAYSQTVTITSLGSATTAPNNNPAVVSAQSLTAGADDLSPTDTVWVNALAPFVADLGPGQVSAPGRTTPVVWEGLLAHAQAFNRFALCDGENVPTQSTIASDAGTVSGASVDPSYGIMLAPWTTYSGPPTGSATPAYPRTVAPSALVGALIARSDGAGNNCDVAPAGNNGMSRNALSVTQVFSDSDRGVLDAAGVGVIRKYRGNIQLYGWTSLALDPNWADAGNCRLRMQIVDNAHRIGDGFVFGDIDAQGHLASAFGGQLTSMLTVLYNQGALYGATPAEAFSVNVGSNVNTPITALARQLCAQISVRMSPTAEQVVINIVHVPVTAAIAA
jgi:hypothetical protein